MAVQKRTHEEAGSRPTKKAKTENAPTKKPSAAPRPVFTSSLVADETDFPRGGGTSLTPFEYKGLREEGRREADAEIAEEKKKRKAAALKRAKNGKDKPKTKDGEEVDKDMIRVEHLNYKRLLPGTRLLARVQAVLPLHLILSLPNQLLAHVPITEVSSTLTDRLTKGEKEDDEDMEIDANAEEDDEEDADTPELSQLYQPGQYVSGIVTQNFPSESSNKSFLGMYTPTEQTRLASRIEMSLRPEKVNEGVMKADVTTGYRLTGSVKSEEDHGFAIDLGLKDVEGFLKKEDAATKTLFVGQVLDFVVTSSNGRLAQLTIDETQNKRTLGPDVYTNVSSILPGHLVNCLITAIIPAGLNVKISGFFDGTIDLTHLGIGDKDIEKEFKLGKKIKARIIYDNLAQTPKRFGLSLLPHIIDLSSPKAAKGKGSLETPLPIGTFMERVNVVRVAKDFGLECQTQEGYHAFVHISHVADERPAALSATSGTWRIGTKHKARVIGHSPMDGVILLSFEKRVLEQRFMQVSEIKVGEVMKGTISRFTDKAIFINVSGSVDGVVWPLHYADIQLKHPEKRFKAGNTVKCRVFGIEPEKSRVKLTLKKSLVDSKFPTPASFEEYRGDMVTSGVISKIFEKGCLVELFGGQVAYVPMAEASESFIKDLHSIFFVGKPVNVKITSIDRETRKMFASIKQALPTFVEKAAINVDDVVTAEVAEVHQDQIAMKVLPSGARGILSIGNLAHFRNVNMASLRKDLKIGETLEHLKVVAKNPDNGLLILVNQQSEEALEKSRTKISGGLELSSLSPGQVYPARVSAKINQSYIVKVTKNTKGRLHFTDMADDYDTIEELSTSQIVKCSVVNVDVTNHQIDFSTRPSRFGDSSAVKDREINGIDDVKVGQKLRGFVKNISSGGVYVALGRNVTARVMIKELFDDFVAEWQGRFQVNQLVQGKITGVDVKKNQVEMSFKKKPGKVAAKQKPTSGLADFAVGQKVDTLVRKVEPYGVFLRINGTNLSGLCHRSEVSDDPNADVANALSSYREGDKLKAKIVSIDSEKNKISFGIKPSYFSSEDFGATGAEQEEDAEMEAASAVDEEEEAEVSQEDEEDEEDNDEVDADDLEESDMLALGEDDSEEELDVEEDSDDEIIVQPQTKKAQKESTTQPSVAVPSLEIKGGFSWTGADVNMNAADETDEESESEAGSEDEAGKPAHSHKRKSHAPYQDLTGDVHTKRPESTEEFERALVGSPNSSFLWVQYMSFQLELSEVDKAREIGRRALRTINYREEDEKLNVWMALLNLENAHGTAESFDKLFKEAAQYNDAETIHLRVAAVLTQTGKNEAAEEIYKRATKKFGQRVEVWAAFAEYYFQRDDPESARALLPRSMKSLPESAHVKIIERFALLEFRLGEAERGKTIYEGLVDKYPKKLNLWNAYIDQIGKQGDIQGVRNLVDRALDQKLNVHKAKFLFKKLLSLETRIGDAAGQERAKEKARDWVSKHAA
ncbi:rRNA biogenesis protein rrp5 [Naganishia albida]|nr:rRNA biogenesis protein rrp5 [Naganishia albida]